MKKDYTTKSEAETIKLAARFAKTLRGGDIVSLEGELGAGKTVFVKGLAKALGVREQIKSPTFVLMKVHNLKNSKFKIQNSKFRKIYHLVHIDAYRVNNAEELRDIGIEEYLGAADAVTVIEWGERARPLCRGKKFWRLRFAHAGKTKRKITFLPPKN